MAQELLEQGMGTQGAAAVGEESPEAKPHRCDPPKGASHPLEPQQGRATPGWGQRGCGRTRHTWSSELPRAHEGLGTDGIPSPPPSPPPWLPGSDRRAGGAAGGQTRLAPAKSLRCLSSGLGKKQPWSGYRHGAKPWQRGLLLRGHGDSVLVMPWEAAWIRGWTELKE